jgi:hypothetical protein
MLDHYKARDDSDVECGEGPLSRVATEARRFPPAWSVEETDACFIV